MTSDLYLGLISGTSADGIDAALVRFGHCPHVIAAHTFPYDPNLRQRLLMLMVADAVSLDELGSIDVEVGRAFGEAANALLAIARVAPDEVVAIGSHGQTIRHRPQRPFPFTMQIGDPNQIAEIAGIRTVADFRRRDMAAGGQGAPLVCALHADVFAGNAPRAVLNLGGIANFTLLAPDRPVRGFDTGPANCLLDAWAQEHTGQSRDEGGAFAASGQVIEPLLTRLLAEPYFGQPAPKSTGREQFNLRWLLPKLRGTDQPNDVQATLLALSAQSIAKALAREQPDTVDVIACGGGVHNAHLLDAVRIALERDLGRSVPVSTTADHGIDPDFVEAVAFAWLARRTLRGEPGNCPEVTGAMGPRILGAVF